MRYRLAHITPWAPRVSRCVFRGKREVNGVAVLAVLAVAVKNAPRLNIIRTALSHPHNARKTKESLTEMKKRRTSDLYMNYVTREEAKKEREEEEKEEKEEAKKVKEMEKKKKKKK